MNNPQICMEVGEKGFLLFPMDKDDDDYPIEPPEGSVLLKEIVKEYIDYYDEKGMFKKTKYKYLEEELQYLLDYLKERT